MIKLIGDALGCVFLSCPEIAIQIKYGFTVILSGTLIFGVLIFYIDDYLPTLKYAIQEFDEEITVWCFTRCV